jgi:hypothetical protein
MFVLLDIPFHLQIKIMSYRPRLQKFPRSIVLSKHLNNKYCKVCGEYIEGLKYTGDPFPVHAHTSRYFYMQKETKYLKIKSYYATNLFKKQFSNHSVTIKNYDECFEGDVQLPFEIIFQKKGLQYYYNFADFCNERSKKIQLMIDYRMTNIFENPNCWLSHTFIQLFPELSLEMIHNVWMIYLPETFYLKKDSLEHEKNINIILSRAVMYNQNYIKLFFTSLLQYESVFYSFLQIDLKNTIHVMNISLRTPNFLYIKAIEFDIKAIDYITEKKLVTLFSYYSSFFIKLYEKDENVCKYFTLYDPLQETFEQRQILFDIK